MRAILAVLGAVLLGPSLAAAGELSVKLNLTERAGVARTAEPVSGGVPLPAGAIKDVSELAVLDAAGKPVPAQFAVLNRHWDSDGKPPKWVLVSFQADVPASGKAAYTLVTGGKNPAPIAGVSVKQEAGAVAVSTGALDAVIDTAKLSLFKSAKVGGKELVGDGAEAGFIVEGMDGVRYCSTKDLVEPLKVTVLESGPVRANVLVEGVIKAGDNSKGYEVADGRGGKAKVAGRDGEKVGFAVRYEFYAGKPFVRVFHTLRMLGEPFPGGEEWHFKGWPYYVDRAQQKGNYFVKAAELVVNLKLDGAAKYVLGGDAEHVGELAAGENAYMYQGSSAGWVWQVAENKVFDPGLKSNAEFMKKQGKDKPYYEYDPGQHQILTKREGCPFMGYKLFAGKRGAEAEKLQGNRALGWADLSSASGGVAVGVRWFWQMFPKTVELGADGKVVMGLWPKRWERSHCFEGSGHLTHETFWYFHAGDATAAKAAEFAKAFDKPTYVLCDPAWYIEDSKCKVFAAAVPLGKAEFGTYDDWAFTAVHEDWSKGKLNYSYDSSIGVEHEKNDEFGVWHFGDSVKDSIWWYFGQFQEYDLNYTLLLHLARSGDTAFMSYAEQSARELMGIPAHEGGYGHQWPESSHTWSRGLTLYYLMTGLSEAREAMDWMGMYHIKAAQGSYHKDNAWSFNGRNAAWALRGLYSCYDLTGEKKYMDEFNRGLGIIREKQQKGGANLGLYGGGGPLNFQLGTVSSAAGEWAWLTGDEDALDFCLGTVEFFRPRKGQKDWIDEVHIFDGYTYAYLLTGQAKYKDMMEAGAAELLKLYFTQPAHYRQGTCSVKMWTRLVRYCQPYMYLKANPRKDEAPPAAVKDLAVEASGGGKVAVTLTAPGGDGAEGGKAARYQLKYATAEIVEDSREAGKGLSFWAAANAKGEPAPGAPGAKEKFEISGLKPGKYWFAVKTRDAAENLSDISNVVTVEVK
ncbi:MAG TPA: hypothetical protein PK280_04520 [Planctomycetota bacterium]|nr:hypothetical protein [Planctomycetota bacterium]